MYKYRFIIVTVLLLIVILLISQRSPYKKELEIYRRKGVDKSISCDGTQLEKIISTAKMFLGTKHQLGGKNQYVIDCSGLVYVSFAKSGVLLPRSASEQGRFGKQIEYMSRLRQGDLVFFHVEGNKALVNHVGIYLGNKEFVHVSSSKGCVITNIKSDYWADAFLFGTRLCE